MHIRRLAILLAFATAILHAATAALGGRVFQQASDPFGWVGTPIQLDYVFENVSSHDRPELPQVPGLTITPAGTPSVFESTSNFNGTVTKTTTLTYRFLVNASAPGRYELPSFTLHADGQTHTTEPFPMEFRDSIDMALLRAEVRSVPDHIWLGDVVPATLRVSVKPFADSQLSDGVMSAADMWRQVDPDASQWGPFLDAVKAFYGRQSMPPARIITVQGGPTGSERWYAYDIEATIAPDRVGEIDFSDISVFMNYPMQLQRSRGSFFDPLPSLKVARRIPVTAVPTALTSQVVEPPTAGRPPTWSGAVGRFTCDVTATPTTATVGEPITLTMRITDIGGGHADMDALQAPLLQSDAALTTHFKVPDERPGGIVTGQSKVFTQSIRATSDEPTVIPPIAFAFFDPTTEAYDTVYSRPIPVQIETARTVASEDLGAGITIAPVDESPQGLTAVQGGLLANYTDPAILLASPRVPGVWWLLAILLAPPLAFVVFVTVQDRMAAERGDPTRGRARRARSVLMVRLADSGGAPDAVAAALRNYVADRLGLPEAGLTRVEAVAALQGDAAAALNERLSELEGRAYAGGAGTLTESDLAGIRSLGDMLERATR